MRGRSTFIKKSAIRRRAFLFTAAIFGVGLGIKASADTTSNWTTGSNGNWTDATQWSTNPNYPNNNTPAGTFYIANIAIAGTAAYTVTNTAVNTAVDTLTLNSNNATLLQDGNLTAGFLNITKGTLVADGFNQAASVTTSNLTNSGLLKGVNGSTLTFSTGSYDNTNGTIEADSGATVNFVYPFSGATVLGNLVNNGGTMVLTTLSSSFPLILTPTVTFGTTSTGTWLIHHLAFENNTLNVPDAQMSFADLIGCTLASNLISTRSLVIDTSIVANGHTLTIAGANTVSSVLFEKNSGLQSLGNYTLTNANINIGGFASLPGHSVPNLDSSKADSFSIDTNSTVSGNGEIIYTDLINRGSITATAGALPFDLSGAIGNVSNGTLLNLGTLQAVGGGTLQLPRSNWTNNGILSIDSISKIAESGNLVFADGSSFNDTLSNSQSGLLQITGNLDLSHNESLNLSNLGTLLAGEYEIASYTGSLIGTFAQVTPGYAVDYSHSGEVFVNVPEPAAFGVLTACGALLCSRRRRRPNKNAHLI